MIAFAFVHGSLPNCEYKLGICSQHSVPAVCSSPTAVDLDRDDEVCHCVLHFTCISCQPDSTCETFAAYTNKGTPMSDMLSGNV